MRRPFGQRWAAAPQKKIYLNALTFDTVKEISRLQGVHQKRSGRASEQENYWSCEEPNGSRQF